MIRTVVTAGFLSSALFLTACSGSHSTAHSSSAATPQHSSSTTASPTTASTARELWDAAAHKVADYKSVDVHIEGNSTQVTDGAAIPLTLEVKGATDDSGDTALTVSGNGQRTDAFSVKSQWYVHANAGYWEQQTGSATTAAKYADKWVKMSPSFTMNTSRISELITDFTDEPAPAPAAMRQTTTKVSSTTADGQPVWKLSATDGQVALISRRTGEVLEYSSPKRSSNGFVVQRMQIVSHDRDYSMKAPANAVTFEEK